jgi:F-type H+-transporting ATPase subunit delta
MNQKLSRRKIADYFAEKVLAGDNVAGVLKEIAAYLIDSGRTREIELVVRALEDSLSSRGTVVASVASARPLDETMKFELATLIGAKTVLFRETVDPELIGGVLIETPQQTLDATIKRKLTALHGAKI